MFFELERNAGKHKLINHLGIRAVGGGGSNPEIDDEKLSISREKSYRDYVDEFAKYYKGNEDRAIADIRGILNQNFDSKQMAVCVSPGARQYRVFLGDKNFEKAMKITSEAFAFMLEKILKHNITSITLDKSNFLIKIGIEKPPMDKFQDMGQNEGAVAENFFEKRSSKQVSEFKEKVVNAMSYYRSTLYYRIGLDRFNSQGFEDSYIASLTMTRYFIREFMGHEMQFRIAAGKVVGTLNEIVLKETDEIMVRMKEAERNVSPYMDNSKLDNVIQKYSQPTDEFFPTYTCTLLKDKDFPEEAVEVQKLIKAAEDKVKMIDNVSKKHTVTLWSKNRLYVLQWADRVQKIIEACKEGKMGYKTGDYRRPWGNDVSNLIKFIENHEDFTSKSSNALIKLLTLR